MSKTAKLYRMVTDEHICPFGLKSKALLEQQGYQVTDHQLSNKQQTAKFKQQHQVDTTPQTFINEQRIGGYDQLLDYFNKTQPADKFAAAYRPVIAIFAIALLLALAINWAAGIALLSIATVEKFVACSMVLLALQKLQDVEAFSNQFLGYDLLAQRWVRYAYFYPFAEAFAGIGMLAGLAAYFVAPVALFIGMVGAISVMKAVYIDKRELKCACVGGNSEVPLGFVSLTENLFMIAAGCWMLFNALM
ncbi:MauE/DoxX family redox-associated membrane protein [Arsukibacterium perlucidum]|uniref:MauE/DoxX family redox-associated membrane protein n=1 Tax=Arsukibacterium perlucidum TaxID=368811 RepID=UPI00036479EF|nr:MauE/DoxX family redox-associated membrane protein [Arsukibacterium perlucidum]